MGKTNGLGQSFTLYSVSEAFSFCFCTLASLEGRELSWITFTLIALFTSSENANAPCTLMYYVGMFI